MSAPETPTQSTSGQPPKGARSRPDEVRRAAISSYLGNTMEYYDFLLYSVAAAVVFGPLFFSPLSPNLALIASFATLAAGYLVRPLSGIVLGFLGDRIGRKRVLIGTIVLMAVGSGLIGLLPTYEQIGVAAPVLLVLLRIVQGIAVGGEWGGAITIAAEHAPNKWRGFITSISQAGQPSGGLLATLAFASVSLLPNDQFMAWGWRIPFLLSFLLLGLSFYLRLRVSESPVFEEHRQNAAEKPNPVTALRRHPIPLLRGMAASLPLAIFGTLFGAWAVAYAVESGHDQSTVLIAQSAGWAAAIIMMPVYGALSDLVGRRRVYVAGAIAFAVLAYPVLWAIGSTSTTLMFVAFIVVFALISVAMSGVLGALLSELFPTAARYTGVSAAYQITTIASGVTPVAATTLVTLMGIGGVVAALALVCVVAAVAVWTGQESRGVELQR